MLYRSQLKATRRLRFGAVILTLWAGAVQAVSRAYITKIRKPFIKSYRILTCCMLASLCLLSGGAWAQVITEFSAGISAGAAPAGITAGPDGNLWFTEASGNRIGRITPLGVVTEFSAGISAFALPSYITSGPDGNLWFSEQNGNRIGRITPLGVVTEFSAGISPGAQPTGITAGPDGNLWFAEANGNRIGRITPLGVVTEFSVGITPGAAPLDITAGPDGNLWFTELNGNRIGRITPLGVITEFSTGITPGAFPYDITAGPDGNLWFTEQIGNRIGRITTGSAAIAPPTFAKSFGAASIPLNGSTSLSFTINNPNTSALTGAGFTDTLPAGLVVSTPNALTGSCGGGTITATAASGAVSLSGATLGGSTSCTFSVNVTGTTAGTQNNTTGAVTSVEGGAGTTASASVIVFAVGGPPPSSPSTVPTLSEWSLLLLGIVLAYLGTARLRRNAL